MFLYMIFYAYDHILYLMKSWLDTFNSTNMLHYTLNTLKESKQEVYFIVVGC